MGSEENDGSSRRLSWAQHRESEEQPRLLEDNGQPFEPLLMTQDQDGDAAERRRSSRVQFSQMQSLDPTPGNVRSSVYRRESFIVQFAKTKGPPQITFLMMLIAIGLGCTIGVVPAVMSDRFARLNHGYEDDADCASFHDVSAKPAACFAGSADAQSAAANSNLISNALTFLTSSLIGSLSDEYGRKGVLVAGLSLGMMAPLMLFLLQILPRMSPWWYYGFSASTGLVNWVAIALSALADVLPQRFRAPGIGILLAGFMLGFSLSPILSFLFSNLQLSFLSFLVVVIGLIATICVVPETLPPRVAEETRMRRELEDLRHEEEDNEYEEAMMEAEPSGTSSFSRLARRKIFRATRKVKRIVFRPIKEMAILNRNTFFRLISLLAFFSGMVSSGDQVLLTYYVEEQLGFTAQDVSLMFLIIGVMGLMAQGIFLKPLNDLVGEKLVVAICFFIGAVDNTMYGLARNKSTIYAAVALSAFTGMAFPTISAIKANNVAETEQGRIQGALYSLSALASGVGPVLLRSVYGRFKETSVGPGAMFVFAGMLYLVAVAVACALPKDKANARPEAYADDEEEEDLSGSGTNETDRDQLSDVDFQLLASDSSDDGSRHSYGAIS